MDLSKLTNKFLWFVTWICQNWYMDFSKLLHGFVKVVTWICQSCSMYFSPFAKQNQPKFLPRFQSLLKLLLRTKGFYESKNSMPWVHCAFGNVCFKYFQFHFHFLIPVSHLQFVHAIELWNKWFERPLPKKISLTKKKLCSFDPMMYVLIFPFPFSIFVSHFHFLPAIKFCNEWCERRLPKNWQFEGGRQWSEPN